MAHLIARWYVRCHDCLSVAAVETDPTPQPLVVDGTIQRDQHGNYLHTHARCGACDGRIEIMGRVAAGPTAALSYLVTGTETRAACDARCTNARGPNCDCQCGGKNHGSGATVEVVFTDLIPRVAMKNPAKARLVAAEWHAAIERATQTRPGRLAQLRGNGEYLPRTEDYHLAEQFRAIMAAARSAKSHKARLAALARITEQGIARSGDNAVVQ